VLKTPDNKPEPKFLLPNSLIVLRKEYINTSLYLTEKAHYAPEVSNPLYCTEASHSMIVMRYTD
jgi:hypothetical protein